MSDGIAISMTATAARFESRMQGFARRVMTDGSPAVQAQIQNVRQVLIATSPVATGFFRDHWGPVTQGRTPLTWRVQNPTPYGPTLEYGGYRGVGPRMIALGGGDLGEGFTAGAGIYSRQAPLGFMRRALAQAAPQLRQRIHTVVRQAWAARDMGGGWPSSQAVPLPAQANLGALFGIELI